MKITRVGTVRSTFDTAIELVDSGEIEGVVIATEQTAGRGTKGRSYLSREGGVYITYYNSKANLAVIRIGELVQIGIRAVSKTLNKFGLAHRVKLPNDVYVGDKKISGTRIINTIEGDRATSIMIGIGLNVTNELGSVADIATNMAREGIIVSADVVTTELITNLQEELKTL